ncbi:histidine phosphatase family protein [Agromyces mediolanus]|uniref:histidine phosphatase family protein n=1 Tax=Agromyces mediolanus TaxID=41986 RepID=UPI00203D110E|nr:histidine phosphatase family protein [Agromyces mediolanus]MCM3657743.1 histidine phosphatase family protein [Agromyces mediolanus]
MPAEQIHLVRHGEVSNPQGVLYGRLPGYGLSELGRRMAEAAAADLVARGRSVSALVVSPLQRTRESAAPIAAAFELEPIIDERVIEPTNRFEGTRMRGPGGSLRNPTNWPALMNPWRPGWGEPYRAVVARMVAAIVDASASVDGGDVVVVSHQMPIWMTHLHLAGQPLAHDPRRRRCALSSITTLEPSSAAARGLVEIGYRDPAATLAAGASDVGAV